MQITDLQKILSDAGEQLGEGTVSLSIRGDGRFYATHWVARGPHGFQDCHSMASDGTLQDVLRSMGRYVDNYQRKQWSEREIALTLGVEG